LPHCIIEYSKELEKIVDPSVLVESVYQGALKTNFFEETDIKTRAIAFEHHQIGSLKMNFIHVTLKILAGRSTEKRVDLSNSILTELRVLPELKGIGLSDISLTIEVCEIEKITYAKSVIEAQ